MPFELFLFAYAVLGPLHYLTEINWLESKNYFINSKKWFWVFIVLAIVISIPFLLRQSALLPLKNNSFATTIYNLFKGQANLAILIAFTFSIILINFIKNTHIILGLLVSIICSYFLLKYIAFASIIVGVFIPTIIHVYVFTLLFMILGTINNRTRAGIIAIILLITIPITIYLSNIQSNNYALGENIKNIFLESKFHFLSQRIANSIGAIENRQFYFLSPIGIKIQIFIAFCYTYHYLNWFSKTNIIGWNKNISKTKFVSILILWGICIFLYWYNNKTGFAFLFLLSFLHVLLEFPLNIKSIVGIYKGILPKNTSH